MSSSQYFRETILNEIRRARELYTGLELAAELSRIQQRLDNVECLSVDVVINLLLTYRDIQVHLSGVDFLNTDILLSFVKLCVHIICHLSNYVYCLWVFQPKGCGSVVLVYHVLGLGAPPLPFCSMSEMSYFSFSSFRPLLFSLAAPHKHTVQAKAVCLR